jgi:hypothetical protein
MTKEPEFVVREFKECRKGQSLQGFVTIELPSGLVLHDCAWHARADGSKWLGMPARSFVKSDGETGWFRLVDFTDKDAHARFQKLAREAVDRYLDQNDADMAPLLDTSKAVR